MFYKTIKNYFILKLLLYISLFKIQKSNFKSVKKIINEKRVMCLRKIEDAQGVSRSAAKPDKKHRPNAVFRCNLPAPDQCEVYNNFEKLRKSFNSLLNLVHE